jgi:hypothetical protein
MLSYPAYAAPGSGGDTVQGLYDVLLSTMKNGRTLGQSGRFTQLEPVIRRTFDIPCMARLSVGPSRTSLNEAQRQQVTESFGRYIAAIYADRFDCYAWQKLQVTGCLGQGRFRATDLSSFRIYLPRLSTGYGGFRSGEEDSFLGNRPRFPHGGGFPPKRFCRAPGSPRPGAALLSVVPLARTY